MTTPYTDADVDQLHDVFARAWTAHLHAPHPLPEQCAEGVNTEDCCDRQGLRAVLDALAAAGRLTPAPHPVPADERPDPAHVVTFTDGTWTMTHPADCTVATPTGPTLICLVRDLAVEQLAGIRWMSGRYEVAANGDGDRLRILDRLHDDQCTYPVCAACGCWCHTPAEPIRCCEDPAGRDHGHTPGTGRVCAQQDEG